jgi:malonyl-CoA O-methyltransferase
LPWVSDVESMLREWRRVLRPDGLLVFTSLGPDTLQAWRIYLGDYTIPNFIDMHEIGDMLTRARFSDPVMDVEYYTLTYSEPSTLLSELQASGMLVAHSRLDLRGGQKLTWIMWLMNLVRSEFHWRTCVGVKRNIAS